MTYGSNIFQLNHYILRRWGIRNRSRNFLAEDGVDYFIIEVSSDLLSAELLINEGNWVDSGKKGYMYRIDAENPSIKQQRHVHIAKSKHISNKNMQVSWNQDGSKHDKKSFNSNVASLNIVQLIARDAFKSIFKALS